MNLNNDKYYRDKPNEFKKKSRTIGSVGRQRIRRRHFFVLRPNRFRTTSYQNINILGVPFNRVPSIIIIFVFLSNGDRPIPFRRLEMFI